MDHALTDDPASIGELVAVRYYSQGFEDGIARGRQVLEEDLVAALADWEAHRERDCWCDACALLRTLAREFARLGTGGVALRFSCAPLPA